MLATRAGGIAESPLLMMTKLEHLSAHLMMEFKPSEQIRAQSRTESTMTTFASKFPSPRYDDSVVVESWPFVEDADGGFAGDWLSGEWSSNLLEWKSSRRSWRSGETKDVAAYMLIFFVVVGGSVNDFYLGFSWLVGSGDYI